MKGAFLFGEKTIEVRMKVKNKLEDIKQEPQECESFLRAITVGITARNEEATIDQTIDSLTTSASLLPKWVKHEFLVCINDCNDRTEFIVDEIISNYQGKGIKIRKVKSKQGKTEAQRKIIRERQYKEGLVFFFDADIVIDRLCLPALWLDFFENPRLQVSYATVMPYFAERQGLVSKIIAFHYNHPEIQNKRQYFYGRAFGIRNWGIPDFANPSQLSLRQKQIITEISYSYLQLEKGPLIDDVCLSRQIYHEHGAKAINQNLGAVVYFTPLNSFLDYYYGYRRLWLELERLDILFPEQSYLQKYWFRRKTDFQQVRKLDLRAKFLFVLKKLLEIGTRLVYWGSICLMRLRLLKSPEIWRPLKSTKKPLPNLSQFIDEVYHEKEDKN